MHVLFILHLFFNSYMCAFFTSHTCTLLLDLSVVLSMVIHFPMLDHKHPRMHDGVLDLSAMSDLSPSALVPVLVVRWYLRW